jgi:putative hydrolase of the HAD superfamily
MPRYRHLFFDLDHTLWDFETNARETLAELYEEFDLAGRGAVAIDRYITDYETRNAWCWAQYRAGQMNRETLRVARFQYLLDQYNISDRGLAYTLSDEYLNRCPLKPHLMPHAWESLTYLKEKYRLHLITNGFRVTQFTKLRKSKLESFFDTITTSEEAGVLKPDPRMFHYALRVADVEAHDSIYIGDHIEVDMKGAREAGLDQVFYNPKRQAHAQEVTFEIYCLSQLQELF